jgi:hypothetical protein
VNEITHGIRIESDKSKFNRPKETLKGPKKNLKMPKKYILIDPGYYTRA